MKTATRRKSSETIFRKKSNSAFPEKSHVTKSGRPGGKIPADRGTREIRSRTEGSE
jgi:hypothetical protein